MNDKIKNIVVTLSFLIFISFMLIINLLKKDTILSISERRKLQQFPKISINTLLNGSFFKSFENYTMDQFIQREAFRALKVNVEMSLLKKQDSNHIYVYDGKLIEQIYPLNEKSVANLTKKMNEIHRQYLTKNTNIYYTIVPDKNYFVKENNLKLNYTRLKELMTKEIEWAKYIDIFDCLDLSSYYATDSHWKQERLQKVVTRLASNMNLEINTNYTEKKIVDFKGVYAGQYPIQMKEDEIKILTNEVIENCIVYHYETNKETKVYDLTKINSLDKYDIYLSGATPLLTIENPNCNQQKELIVFRDSYGSSLVPLLIEGYAKITLIDTRYISPKVLNQYVDFDNNQ